MLTGNARPWMSDLLEEVTDFCSLGQPVETDKPLPRGIGIKEIRE